MWTDQAKGRKACSLGYLIRAAIPIIALSPSIALDPFPSARSFEPGWIAGEPERKDSHGPGNATSADHITFAVSEQDIKKVIKITTQLRRESRHYFAFAASDC